MNNHWFLSAIMCIAENPKLIRRLFKTKFYNKKNLKEDKNGTLFSNPMVPLPAVFLFRHRIFCLY